MAGIIVIGNLLSKFKVVMSYLSGEKGEGIPVNGIMSTRITAGMQRMYCVGEGYLSTRTSQVMAEPVRAASVSPLV